MGGRGTCVLPRKNDATGGAGRPATERDGRYKFSRVLGQSLTTGFRANEQVVKTAFTRNVHARTHTQTHIHANTHTLAAPHHSIYDAYTLLRACCSFIFFLLSFDSPDGGARLGPRLSNSLFHKAIIILFGSFG